MYKQKSGDLDVMYDYQGNFGYAIGLVLGVSLRRSGMYQSEFYYMTVTLETAEVYVDSLPSEFGFINPSNFPEIEQQLPGKYVMLLSRIMTSAYQIIKVQDEPFTKFQKGDQVYTWDTEQENQIGNVVGYDLEGKVLIEYVEGVVPVDEDKVELFRR